MIKKGTIIKTPKNFRFILLSFVFITIVVSLLPQIWKPKTSIVQQSREVGCKEIVAASPVPSPYDRNNPYSHVSIRKGLYVDYIQGYCFKFTENDFGMFDGWFTSPKNIIDEQSEDGPKFNFEKPYLTINSSARTLSKPNEDADLYDIKTIQLPIGSTTERDNYRKIEELKNNEFERATFYYRSETGEYGGRVSYKTKWYLPGKNKLAEFSLYAHSDYTEEVEEYKKKYDEIIESFEFF